MSGKQQIRVEIIGDDKQLSGTLAKADKGFGGLLKSGVALGAGFELASKGVEKLSEGLAIGFERAEAENKITAQLSQALKTTGDASGQSVGGLQNLATEIQNKTGIDKLQIESSEKLLLAFTGVRDEAGKGNDVFDRAIGLIQDYSARTGKSAAPATLAFGKALEDPTKKLGGLAKMGVTFTDGQKKMIEKLQASGDKLGAQKIVLEALTKRYGGAAEAAGDTLGGKLSILKLKLEDVAEKIANKVMPYVERFIDFIVKESPTISRVVTEAMAKIEAVLKTLGPYLEGFVNVVKDLTQKKWGKAWDDLVDAVRKALGGVLVLAQGMIQKMYGVFGGLADNLLKAAGFGNLGSTVRRIFGDISKGLQGEIEIIRGILSGDWSKVWDGAKKVLFGWVDVCRNILQGLAQLVWDLLDKAAAAAGRGAAALAKMLLDQLKAGLVALESLATQWIVDPIVKVVTGLATTIVDKAKAVGSAISSSIATGVTGAVQKVTDAVVGIGTTIGNLASRAWDAVVALGKGLAGRIAEGIATGGLSEVVPKVIDIGGQIGNLAGRAWDAVQGLGKSLAGKIGSGIAAGAQAAANEAVNIGGMIGNLAGRAWDAVVGLGRSLAGKVGDGISAGVGRVTDAVINFGAAIGGLAGRAWGAVSGLGASLVQKIADGISGAGGKVAGAISGIFGGLAGWVKSILGISSPSTVFMDIGHNIVAGLVKGLWNKAGDLKDAAVAMAKKLLVSWPYDKIKALFKAFSNVPADVKALFPDSVWQAIFGIPSERVAPGAGPGGASSSAVPARTGGLFTSPTIALIGEDGPEAVVPLTPTQGGPAFMRGGFGGGDVYVVFPNATLIGTGLAQAARELEGHITAAQRQREKRNTGRVSRA